MNPTRPLVPLARSQVLDQFYLDARARLLDLAAMLDRFDRADTTQTTDPRAVRLREAIAILNSDVDNRAEQMQLFFSLAYDPSWKRPEPRS